MNDHTPAQANAEGVRMRGDGYTAEAGWFGPEDRPRFGWLYRPDTPATNRVGIVIVPPFGREDICAHRTLRHLAEDAAKAGFVAVRFDLDGTGDSAGNDTDPARVPAWQSSIHDACDLARNAGASQLVLVGVRLGAMLATLVAAERHDIAALVAFNAVVSGKAYLRELRAFQSAMNLQAPPEPIAPETGQETSGFLFTEETCVALTAIDLATLKDAPAAVACVLERDDMPERKGWPERLQSLGVDASTSRIPGYVEMLKDPHANRVAQAFIDACLACACSLPGRGETPKPMATSQLRSRITLVVGDAAICEEVVVPDGMFGVLTRPLRGDSNHAVLMLNAGAIRHIGSNRMDVPLSRQLAAMCTQVLRADLTGIGDSPVRAGEPENIVYYPRGIDDTGELVAWLHAQGARNVTVGGMCSGAYYAVRGAIAGQPIQHAYMINCGVFDAKVDFNPEGGKLFGDIAHYNESMKSARSWRRLLTGKVALGTVFRVALWHVQRRVSRVYAEIARFLRLPMRDDLGNGLLAVARRGILMNFLFAESDPGRALLASKAGSAIPRLRRKGYCEIRVFKGVDHTFTQRWAQASLHEDLLAILTSRTRDDA